MTQCELEARGVGLIEPVHKASKLALKPELLGKQVNGLQLSAAFQSSWVMLTRETIFYDIGWSPMVPRGMLVEAGRDSFCFSIDATTCQEQGCVNLLCIAVTGSVVVSGLFVGSGLVIGRGKDELKYIVSNFRRDADE